MSITFEKLMQNIQHWRETHTLPGGVADVNKLEQYKKALETALSLQEKGLINVQEVDNPALSHPWHGLQFSVPFDTEFTGENLTQFALLLAQFDECGLFEGDEAIDVSLALNDMYKAK